VARVEQQQKDRLLGIYWDGVPDKIATLVRERVTAGDRLECVALQPGGGGVVITNRTMAWYGISETLRQTLQKNTGQEIHSVAFSGPDQWALILGNNGYIPNNFPADLTAALKEINNRREAIHSLTIAPEGGWYFIRQQNGNYHRGVPADLLAFTQRMTKVNNPVETVALGRNNAWAVVWNGFAFQCNNVPAAMVEAFWAFNKTGRNIYTVSFAANGGWIIVGTPPAARNSSRRR
jgi:hypothetical protein